MDAEAYNRWNEKKQKLNSHSREILFKEGEIWWCSLGVNVGEEVYGKGKDFSRPVVILKKLTDNFCVVLPVTTQPHNGSWYHHFLLNEEDRRIAMHQIRSISANRLSERLYAIPSSDLGKLKKSVAFLLGLS